MQPTWPRVGSAVRGEVVSARMSEMPDGRRAQDTEALGEDGGRSVDRLITQFEMITSTV